MPRLVTALTATLLTLPLIGCTASSDDVGEVQNNKVDVATYTAEDPKTCPDQFWLSLEDYGPFETAETGKYAFYHNNLRKVDGVKTRPSGLQYTVVSEGMANGYTPKSGEEVTVKYHGIRTDGTVFDSSYERDSTTSFATNRVIKGWTESLENMKVCEARRLYIPAKLAYGDRPPARSGIEAGDTLVFDVQMLGVK